MTTTYSDSNIAPRSTDLKALLLEPLLVIGVSAFWLITLPFAAVSIICVKIWDTVVAFARPSLRPNPLILRRGHEKTDRSLPHRASAKQVEV